MQAECSKLAYCRGAADNAKKKFYETGAFGFYHVLCGEPGRCTALTFGFPPSRLGHSQANLDGARCSVGWSASRVYGTLRSTGLLAGYIIPCYDVLHTFSKEYMVEHPDVQHSRPNLDFRGKPAVVNTSWTMPWRFSTTPTPTVRKCRVDSSSTSEAAEPSG